MEPLRQLRSDDVLEFLRIAAVSARAHAPGIDRLDQLDQLEGLDGDFGGDTGTHVAETLEAFVESLPDAASLTELAALLERCAGTGNGTAGRLVAEFLAGVGELCRNTDSLDGTRLAMALEVGAERVADGLGSPRPGGMPAVVSAVAQRALELSDDDLPLPDLIIGVADAGLDALEDTPRQWAPLAEAGVVDAGAAAFLVLIDALVATIHGEDPEPPSWEFPERVDEEFEDSERFRYEINLQVDGTADSAALLGTAWRALGDEISVLGEDVDDGVTLIHGRIRTDDIGPAIEAAIAVGRPHHIVVADTRA